MGYFWSALELVRLPGALDLGLRVIKFDEDLLVVFRIDDGWLVVCETSVRRLVDEAETDRVELSEVVEDVRWQGGILLIRDAAHLEYGVRVEGKRLSVSIR
ncbi:hypothetical protein [Mariniluteicoccus endophyticus]